MTEQKVPTNIMGVSLLHKCNFNCEHCGFIYIGDTEDHIIRPGYRLTWDQVMTAISDCTSLKDSYKTFVSMDKFHKNYNQETGRADSLDNLLGAYRTFPKDKRKLLSTHVVIIVTKDPDSSLPEEMKKHYGSMGITFGDFPMLEIGRAKNLKDQLPEFSGYPPMPVKDSNGPPVLVLVGDDYYVKYKKPGKLGRMLELYPNGR